MNREAEAYFSEAARWEFDRAEALTRSARRAWIVAAAATVASVIATSAVLALTPLKRVEPYLIRVDRSTGVVDVVPAYTGREPLPEAVTRHLVMEYVTQRERYVPALAEADYDQVGAFHSAKMNQAWAAAWARTNPESPLNRFADGSQVGVQVQSISFLRREQRGSDLVQVRFVTGTTRAGGTEEQTGHFVATLEATYAAPSADPRLRALNPLGFKIIEYRREPEVVESNGSVKPGSGT